MEVDRRILCGCSCHAPSWWLLWAGLEQQQQQQRAAASPAGGASPAPATRQPPVLDLPPTDTHCTRNSLLQEARSTLFLLLRHHSSAPLPRTSRRLRFGGDASPRRAPRCACTLAVTCEAGEQRFRCVRGVRAQLAGSGYTKLPTGGAISRYSSYPFLICTLQTAPLLDSQIMGGKGFPAMACPMRCAACMAALSSM